MKIYAEAKINLTLDIREKRPDGFHEVSTIYQTTGLCDLIEIKKSDTPGIRITSNDKDLACDETNLIYKAADLFLNEQRINAGLDIYLEKIIPYGAGLGGGSSDAAATLKLLNEMFEKGLPDEKLEEYSARLGSDVAFFIKGGAASASGKGEKLKQIPAMPPCSLVLVKPQSHSSTAEAYRALDELGTYAHPSAEAMKKALEASDIDAVCAAVGNSFEDIKGIVCPEFDTIKCMLDEQGADAVLLCGSGSAVCGIFKEKNKAERACETIKKTHAEHRVFLTGPQG